VITPLAEPPAAMAVTAASVDGCHCAPLRFSRGRHGSRYQAAPPFLHHAIDTRVSGFISGFAH